MNRKPSESIGDDDDMEVEEVDSDEWDEEGEGDRVPPNECIFCSHNSKVLFLSDSYPQLLVLGRTGRFGQKRHMPS